jgi:hypothetical protein
MEREKLESMLIEYIDGKLNEIDRLAIEKELMTNPDSYKKYEQLKEVIQLMDRVEVLKPADRIKLKFEEDLQKEMGSVQSGRILSFSTGWYRAAAAVVLLVVGGGAGYLISRYMEKDGQLVAMQKEMELTRQLVLSQINDKQSPSQRIIGIKTAYEAEFSEKTEDTIVDVLIKTMNEDDNSNVRLAAIEALKKFSQEPKVRKALIGSLLVQKDPVVQLALIQLMVEMKEKDALMPLEKIIQDENTLPVVRDEAHVGIFKLS